MARKRSAPKPLAMASSYGDYLRVDDLLALQRPLTAAHDELQFIVVHQVFELWFKLSLFELESAREAMFRGDATRAAHSLRRVTEILKALPAGFDVIETMRPWDFLQFRESLKPASGLQSLQFREIEFLCGTKDRRYLAMFKGEHRRRLEKRFKAPTLWDAYLDLLRQHRMGAQGERQTLASVMRVLKSADRHPLGRLTEALFDLDHRFSIWRARHIRMTMKMIGGRPGTGQASVGKLVSQGYDQMGEGGVDYLRTTISKVFFPILWEARTFLQR